MASQDKPFTDAGNCANRAGRFAFGLEDAKAISTLRQLADDIEAGIVMLHSVTTSSHAAHDAFAVREITIEVMEELPQSGPKIVRG
jgi:hypothetical protein